MPVLQGGRRRTLVTLLAFSCSLSSSVLLTSARAQDTSVEQFEKVDPYTRGQRDAMDRLGYVSYGPFHWATNHAVAHSSEDVRQTLDGTPVLFVETVHFRLASTLATYKVTDDQFEKDLIEAELTALKKKCARVKPTFKLDPWLRMHLYAQRLEAEYADFCQRFGVTDADFAHAGAGGQQDAMGLGPYLGQKQKMTVLLTETTSALGRYLKQYAGVENEYSYRVFFDDCMFFGANFEVLKANNRGTDIAFAASVTGSIAQSFVNGFRNSYAVAPQWFSIGVTHWFGRRVDPRWNQWNAGGASSTEDDKSSNWERRVYGLAKNEACPSWDEMLHWKSVEDLKSREHMIVWSRVDWLMTRKPEELHALLMAWTDFVPGTGAERDRAVSEQQARVQQKVLGAADTLDQAWRAWVLKAYFKK